MREIHRQPDEFAGAHIPGAPQLPDFSFFLMLSNITEVLNRIQFPAVSQAHVSGQTANPVR
jgi:hypothetical protein